MAALDECSPEVRRLGTVDMVLLYDDEAVDYRTECTGFARALRDGLADASFEQVVLLGGDAVVALALLEVGVRRLTVVEEDRERAEEVRRTLRTASPDAVIELAGPGELADLLPEVTGAARAHPCARSRCRRTRAARPTRDRPTPGRRAHPRAPSRAAGRRRARG